MAGRRGKDERMDYERLKKKYGAFDTPAMDLIVEGRSFGTNKKDMIVGEASVELVCGYEASEAVIHIYNCYDPKTGRYMTEDLRPFLMLGSAVSVRMGYLACLEEVFCGFIAQVQFLKLDAEFPCVEVRAMDIKGIMMANAYACQMKSGCYSQAVREILKKPVYQNLQNRGIVGKLDIQETPDKNQKELLEMTGESDYEFIVRAAKRFGYEFFTEKGTLHFRKAKPQKKELMTLAPEQGLLFWQIGYDVRGLVQTVEVRGASDAAGELVAVQKKFSNKISAGNKANALLSQTKKVCIDAAAVTRDAAEWRAEALLEKISYRYGSLEAGLKGLPEVQPGYFVRLQGMGEPADNLFYIIRVTHVMEAKSGYRTLVTGIAAKLL